MRSYFVSCNYTRNGAVSVLTYLVIMFPRPRRMSNVAGVSGRFFTALGSAKINVLAISQGCSERNISAVVKAEESTRALRAIHAAFRLSHSTVRVGIVGVHNNEVGESLLRLLQAQRDKLRKIFDVDIQVVAVVPSSSSDRIVRLTMDTPGSSDSLTSMAYKDALNGATMDDSAVQFKGQTHDIAKVASGGLNALKKVLYQEDCTHHVLFDCTSDVEAGKMHAEWLRSGFHIVTANNAGLAGPAEQREEIRAAERLHGKQSAQYLREVTVGGALPVITTLHSCKFKGTASNRVYFVWPFFSFSDIYVLSHFFNLQCSILEIAFAEWMVLCPCLCPI